MSKGKRYTQEFKIEAVKQITERGYSVAEVSERLGICTKALYHWRSKLSDEQLRIAKPEATEYSLADGERLQLRIKPNGSKHWIFILTAIHQKTR